MERSLHAAGQAALFSVGHGTASAGELLDRLALGSVSLVVDIRSAPGSRRHPHLNRDALEQWLPAAGVRYRWDGRLGGFRRPAPDSPDVVWQNSSFRGYAGHLRTTEARIALADLVTDGLAQPTAFMCSETVWWRCHRRLVADALVLLHAVQVRHLLPNRVTAHTPTPGSRVVNGDVVYDQPPVAEAAANRA